MTNYGDQFTACPECGARAESESIDVGVGLYIQGNFICACGWESDADGKMNVSAYSDYFEEPQMTKIYFTQYLRPNGRKQIVAIDRPAHVVSKADFIKSHGFRFEIEELMTGQVSMTISDDDGDYAIRTCANGPDVPVNVDLLILEFDIPKALKHRASNV